VLGQGRILTIKEEIAVKDKPPPIIAVGDPGILDFAVVGPRQLRLIGQRIGVTDLSLTTADNRTYNFEVHVVPDLHVLRAQLRCIFPDASLRLALLREHIVVEGEARDTAQVARIMETIKAYLVSVQAGQAAKAGPSLFGALFGAKMPTVKEKGVPVPPGGEALVGPEAKAQLATPAIFITPQIINLIRVLGPQQVLLKVRVAELDRTALRNVGADFLAVNPRTGAIVGTQIGGTPIAAAAAIANRMLTGTATPSLSNRTTLFGIFEEGDFAIFLNVLRQNSILKILAEPNLVALNGQQASSLIGGRFPVPVAQTSAATGGAPAVTVQFEPFGVNLQFVPFILDNDTIRLKVDTTVSTVDFALGAVLVPGGSPVPGEDSREAHTTVELRHGQTLAIAGLLQMSQNSQTSRIPVLGEIPLIGTFFHSTSSQRMESEVIVLVTPYLIDPMNPDQVPPSPGDEVKEPNDLELYLLGRIQGRTGVDFRATTDYPDVLFALRCFLRLEEQHIRGPHGFCD
jgi:pilus assembly protein CpaC